MVDQQAALGVATTREEERLMASLGQLAAAPIRFELASDVPQGGVLCALPALLVLGLLRHSRTHFSLPPGYYPQTSVLDLKNRQSTSRLDSLSSGEKQVLEFGCSEIEHHPLPGL